MLEPLCCSTCDMRSWYCNFHATNKPLFIAYLFCVCECHGVVKKSVSLAICMISHIQRFLHESIMVTWQGHFFFYHDSSYIDDLHLKIQAIGRLRYSIFCLSLVDIVSFWLRNIFIFVTFIFIFYSYPYKSPVFWPHPTGGGGWSRSPPPPPRLIVVKLQI